MAKSEVVAVVLFVKAIRRQRDAAIGSLDVFGAINIARDFARLFRVREGGSDECPGPWCGAISRGGKKSERAGRSIKRNRRRVAARSRVRGLGRATDVVGGGGNGGGHRRVARFSRFQSVINQTVVISTPP